MSERESVEAVSGPSMFLRRHRFALVFLAALALPIFLAPLLRDEVFVVRDHFDYFQPLRWFTAAELSAGRLPLWNPYNASGEPWLANPQTGVFYPPAWLFLALPFPTAYTLYLLLHLVLLGWGMYLLLVRSLAPGAALVGAAAVMFAGPVLSLLDVSNNLAALAWLPLVLACALSGGWRRWGASIAGAFLAGEPYFASVAAMVSAIAVLTTAPRDAWREAVRRTLFAALLAFGLSAIQLLPFLEMVQGTDRAAGMDSALVLKDSVPASEWLRVAMPPPRDASPGDPSRPQHFIPIVYCGALAVVLALAGIIAGRRPAFTAGWVLFLLFAVWLSTGPALLLRLPLTFFRYPARMLPLGAVAIAALAAAGWNRLRPERRWADLLIVLVLVADLLPRSRPLLETAKFDPHVVPYRADAGARTKVLRVGDLDPAHRVDWMSGYLNLYDRRFDVFTPAPLANERYVGMHRQLQVTPTVEQLASLSVGWVLTRHALHPPFVLDARRSGVAMFRYPHAQAMAVLQTREGTVPQQAWEIDTSHARVTVEAPSEGLLVISQQMAPGWQVTVDGEAARPRVSEGLFRAVRVPAGRHEVVWAYRPKSLIAGAVMTLVTLLTMFFSIIVKRSNARIFSSVRTNPQ
jgi:hypothetical protein